MLRDGDFALEITIFEEGVPPEFHVYAFANDKPLLASDVKLAIELGRLGNRVDRIDFHAGKRLPEGQSGGRRAAFVRCEGSRRAQRQESEWSYQSYEGRTQIAAKAAETAGIKVEKSGPATINDTIELTGVISMNEDRNAKIGARFPGFVKSIGKTIGDEVAKGEAVATIDRNLANQDYTIVSPIGGVVVARTATLGSATTTRVGFIRNFGPLDSLGRTHAFGADRERVKVGQAVVVENADKTHRAEGKIDYVTPVAEAASQAVVVRVVLDNKDRKWFPGTFVRGAVTIAQSKVPLAVKNSGLQRFRDFTVVFAQVDDTYEVRMLELGKSDGDGPRCWAASRRISAYVVDNSFLVKADIEKSGASHDH